MTIIAKPVIDKQYWILKQDNQKVGIIEAVNGGFSVKIQDKVSQYKTIKMAGRDANIEFEPAAKSKKLAANQVHGFEVTGKVFNALWDVKHKLPLFTRSDKSKSWFAAGWYMVKQHRTWKLTQHPKLITLQRYKYQGPFHSKEEANVKSVS
jgi:hypothetical protein